MAKPFHPQSYLERLPGLEDREIDLALAALALAAPEHEGLSLERYINHLDKLASQTAERFQALLEAGAEDGAGTRLAALKHVLSDDFAYEGDVETYDHIQNADLIRLIDRGRGMPITLAILYMHAGRAQGWQVDGLPLPGHFVCRIEHKGVRLIFDPFHQCRILEASDMREIVKRAAGPQAELSASYYEAAPNRDILIRLQNNIKHRQIEAEDYESALQTVERMRQVAPKEFRLLLDAGVLYAKTDRILKAIPVLEEYIERVPDARARRDAIRMLEEIRGRIH